MPLLLRVDAHDLVAKVAVLAAHVGEGVVLVVVRVLPGVGRRDVVPVPGGGVDVGIVHPVPLPVHDVVADLHVLEDLGRREGGGAGNPRRAPARGQQQHPAQDRQPAVHRDHALDVAAVAVAEVGHTRSRIASSSAPIASSCSAREPRQRVRVLLACRRGGWLWQCSSRSLCRSKLDLDSRPQGALTQVRTISFSVSCTLAGAQVTHGARAQPADAGVADPHAAAEGQACARLLAGAPESACRHRSRPRRRWLRKRTRPPAAVAPAPPTIGWKRSIASLAGVSLAPASARAARRASRRAPRRRRRGRASRGKRDRGPPARGAPARR